MPFRKTPFINGEIYHVVSRSVAQTPIFKTRRDHSRLLEVVDFYKYFRPSLRFSFYNRLPNKEKEEFLNSLKEKGTRLVEILAFCLMPNHLHFLVKQLEDRGAPIFMKNLQDSYARYFNTKFKRNGSLFQSMFKAVRIETDEQLLHVSRYIHLNPVSSYLIKIEDLENYPWCSFGDYLGRRSLEFVNPGFILNFFKTPDEYHQFVFDQADYQRKLDKIKHLILEE